jgi:hypothetical protein
LQKKKDGTSTAKHAQHFKARKHPKRIGITTSQGKHYQIKNRTCLVIDVEEYREVLAPRIV